MEVIKTYNVLLCVHKCMIYFPLYYPAPLYSQTGRQDTVVTQPSYTAPSYHQNDDSAFYEGTVQYHSHLHHHPTSRPPVTAIPTPGPLYDMAAVSHSAHHQHHHGNPVPHMDHHGATANIPGPAWGSASVSYSHPLPAGSHTHQNYYHQQPQVYHHQQHQPQQPTEGYNHSHQHYQVHTRMASLLSIKRYAYTYKCTCYCICSHERKRVKEGGREIARERGKVMMETTNTCSIGKQDKVHVHVHRKFPHIKNADVTNHVYTRLSTIDTGSSFCAAPSPKCGPFTDVA